MKELNEMEKSFFVPINAHPLKKINDSRDVQSIRDNESDISCITTSE